MCTGIHVFEEDRSALVEIFSDWLQLQQGAVAAAAPPGSPGGAGSGCDGGDGDVTEALAFSRHSTATATATAESCSTLGGGECVSTGSRPSSRPSRVGSGSAVSAEGEGGDLGVMPAPPAAPAPPRMACPFWYASTQAGCKAGPECVYEHAGQFQLAHRPPLGQRHIEYAARAWERRNANEAATRGGGCASPPGWSSSPPGSRGCAPPPCGRCPHRRTVRRWWTRWQRIWRG